VGVTVLAVVVVFGLTVVVLVFTGVVVFEFLLGVFEVLVETVVGFFDEAFVSFVVFAFLFVEAVFEFFFGVGVGLVFAVVFLVAVFAFFFGVGVGLAFARFGVGVAFFFGVGVAFPLERV
jgi:hypothetical protein